VLSFTSCSGPGERSLDSKETLNCSIRFVLVSIGPVVKPYNLSLYLSYIVGIPNSIGGCFVGPEIRGIFESSV
jgi:hypothetical protein